MIFENKQKVALEVFTMILLLAGISGCSNTTKQKTIVEETHSVIGKHPKDMVLIYDGGAHRNIHWTNEHFAPYVSYKDQDGSDKWLFDGFLFLEFKDGNGRCFASYYEKEGARKTEWEALVNNYFRKGNAVVALDEQIRKVIKETNLQVPEKRKVVLCLPEPIPDQKDWGTIDQDQMDFSNKTDRLKACQWYIDYATKCFRDASPEYLELTGFYWIAEEATNSRDLALDVSKYIHEKGLNFYWIPYFKSDGHLDWKTFGFDKAYYQPNYFFKEDRPISQIEEACQTAIANGMSLEMEFDENALERKGWGYRLEDYINVFQQFGALDSMDIAYYQGGDAFYKLFHSDNSKDNELYRKLADIIAKRQENKY
ncbi:DUF4855 domain-containing protein [Massilibacteroides sp.]|uniref:DUF4855 domain-containing protein n=1 Tax=Massilibacteroides sp. TaxID=2034766 RepID=UPI002628EA93|nr:DUF4855 domain-containing protein [Massilibacteroides sp.]MDD4516112.1 DUF4855 domain-containing protein [Massilibacteroides sp.]